MTAAPDRIVGLVVLIIAAACGGTPAQPRRDGSAQLGATHVVSHEVVIRVDPAAHQLESADALTLVAGRDTQQVELAIAKMDVVHVRDQLGALAYSVRPVDGDLSQTLTIQLRDILRAGARGTVTVTLRSEDFLVTASQTPVPGYDVLGQVREDSSYSSHVAYYPLDADNRAPVTLEIDVPEDYVAVGPGTLVATRSERGRTITRWRADDRLPKQLPYGWAVARYVNVEARTASGVPINVFALLAGRDGAARTLALAIQVVEFYERVLGPFPFPRVTIAEVSPVRGIAGVSLPGMVLMSSHFFGAEPRFDLDDIEAVMAGPLVVADEIAHHYNFYAVSLSNALSEALAQYTDTLFHEHVSDASVVPRHIAHYAKAYRDAVASAPDAAIISDDVYQTAAYMGIVFNKGACVFHMLRQLVGTPLFHAGLRELFTTYRGRSAGLAELKRVFAKVTRTDLDWFFDQWFTRAGIPRVRLTWQTTGTALTVDVVQLQDGEPYRLPLALTVTSRAQAPRSHPIELTARSQRFTFEAREPVTNVTVDDSAMLIDVERDP